MKRINGLAAPEVELGDALSDVRDAMCNNNKACRGIACEECLFFPGNQLEFNKLILGEKE